LPFVSFLYKERERIAWFLRLGGEFGGWVDGWLAGIMSRTADTNHKNDISVALGHAAAAALATYKASSLQTITNYLQLITL
jgi:hypothetical protein